MDRVKQAQENELAWFRGEAFCSEGADPEFQEIARRFLCGDILSRTVLSGHQKALIFLVTLAAVQTLKPIQKYALAALDMGVSPTEMKEALYHCAPYIGLEKVQAALDEVNAALESAGVSSSPSSQSTVSEATRFDNGLSVQRQIFGAEHIDTMRASAPPELRHIQEYLSAYCFGDFYTRGTLDLKTRELITFCAICSMGGCEPQARAHASANLSVGNSREVLIEAITQCLPLIGFPRTLNALSCIPPVQE